MFIFKIMSYFFSIIERKIFFKNQLGLYRCKVNKCFLFLQVCLHIHDDYLIFNYFWTNYFLCAIKLRI